MGSRQTALQRAAYIRGSRETRSLHTSGLGNRGRDTPGDRGMARAALQLLTLLWAATRTSTQTRSSCCE